MPKSYIFMTAMPPTQGHADLIEYASYLTYEVHVIVCTQRGEPFPKERFEALSKHFENSSKNIQIHNLHQMVPQEPSEENEEQFWVFWTQILYTFGFVEGDYIVSSELYGKDLAEAAGGVFMPYDINRTVNYTKASHIRGTKFLEMYQDKILPEFLPHLRRTVTIFGAESVGKTTLAEELGDAYRATTLPEWARPYLEAVGPEITVEKMERIVDGQAALQEVGHFQTRTLYVIQDTDLFSTLGYWEMWDKDSVPPYLVDQAQNMKSDLYIILSSDIPFEPDPLRLGGDRRETPDQHWIDLCEREGLPYVYITSVGDDRRRDAIRAMENFFTENPLSYQRVGKEYEMSV